MQAATALVLSWFSLVVTTQRMPEIAPHTILVKQDVYAKMLKHVARFKPDEGDEVLWEALWLQRPIEIHFVIVKNSKGYFLKRYGKTGFRWEPIGLRKVEDRFESVSRKVGFSYVLRKQFLEVLDPGWPTKKLPLFKR